MVYRGETKIRTTFQVFIKGVLACIVAEHCAKSQSLRVYVDGKLDKLHEDMTLEQLADIKYTFVVQTYIFVLKWLIEEGAFALMVNGQSLSEFDYVHPSFKLDDQGVELFNATVDLNYMQVSQG